MDLVVVEEEGEEGRHRQALRHQEVPQAPQAPQAPRALLRALANLGAVAAVAVRVDRGIQAQRGMRHIRRALWGLHADTKRSSSSISRPSYGGGRYYGGGATSAYRSGGRSPAGIVPFVLAGAALGFFPGLWLYGAYEYPYSHPYSFHNASNSSEPQGQNETLPVSCLCAQYSACGCDDNNNSTFLDSVVGNGSAADENSTLVHIANVNGTKTIVLNGTLPNGTDTTNSTDNSTDSGSSTTSGALRNSVIENSGFWLMGGIVGATIWMM